MSIELEKLKVKSGWSTNCADESAGLIAIDPVQNNLFEIIMCSGFKCIRYPGFWEPLDIYSDNRFKWISSTEFKLKNNDKDAGWEGYRTYKRCGANNTFYSKSK